MKVLQQAGVVHNINTLTIVISLSFIVWNLSTVGITILIV